MPGPRLGGRETNSAFRSWRAAAIPLLLIALALTLVLPRLTTPAIYVFDELYYAYTAGKYVSGEEAYSTTVLPREDPAIEWTHPPVAKLLIAGGILVAGDNPLGWRIVSVLFGTAGVVIAYLLALSLTGSRATSALAAALLLMDGLYLVESRIGMSNMFVLVFANAALLGLARVLTVAPEHAGLPLLATGLFVGLGIATKWSGVALAGLIGLVVCWRIAQLWHLSRGTDTSAAAAAHAGLRTYLRWAPISLILIPIAVYLASYLHFWFTGHDWADFIALHRDMFAYHRNLGVVHDDSSPWWQWPLAARGIWYYVDHRRREGAFIFGNGNPTPVLADGGGRWLGRHRLVGKAIHGIARSRHWILRPMAALGVIPTWHIHLPFSASGSTRLHGPGGSSHRRMAPGRRWAYRRCRLHPRRDRDLRLVLSALHRNASGTRTSQSADVAR